MDSNVSLIIIFYVALVVLLYRILPSIYKSRPNLPRLFIGALLGFLIGCIPAGGFFIAAFYEINTSIDILALRSTWGYLFAISSLTLFVPLMTISGLVIGQIQKKSKPLK